MGFAGVDRQAQRLGVHVGVHQHFARVVVCGHHRNESVGIELRGQNRAFLDLFDTASLAEFDGHGDFVSG